MCLIAHIVMYTYRNYDFLECALTPCVSRSEDVMNSLLYQMLSLLFYPCKSTVRGKGLLDLQFGGDTVPIVEGMAWCQATACWQECAAQLITFSHPERAGSREREREDRKWSWDKIPQWLPTVTYFLQWGSAPRASTTFPIILASQGTGAQTHKLLKYNLSQN